MKGIARLVIVLALVVASCGQDVEATRLEELAAAEQRWLQAGPSDYTIIVEHGCFCPPETRGPFEVRVVDGAVASVTHTDDAIAEPRPNQELLTVEGIFAFLRENVGSDGFIVRYDADLGYPRSVDLDPREYAIDDELYIGAEIELN